MTFLLILKGKKSSQLVDEDTKKIVDYLTLHNHCHCFN